MPRTGRPLGRVQRREYSKLAQVTLVGPLLPRMAQLAERLCPTVPTVVALPAEATIAQQEAACMSVTIAILDGALMALDQLGIDQSQEDAAA